MSEPTVRQYLISLCDACVRGVGEECHTPGCALWLNRAPRPGMLEVNCFLVPLEESEARCAALRLACARNTERVHADAVSRLGRLQGDAA